MNKYEALRKHEIRAWLLELRYASERDDRRTAGKRIRAHLRRLGHRRGLRGTVVGNSASKASGHT
jgi:hypothetical protein